MEFISAELVISLLVVSLQLYFFLSTRKQIKVLERLFPDTKNSAYLYKIIAEKEGLTDGNEEYSIIAIVNDSESITEHFRKIIDATNKYLKGNKGAAADFNILKNISERISEAEENVINSRISLPLFIGLMGTFLGVILGIVSIYISANTPIPNQASATELNRTSQLITDVAIKNFLGGVFIAMMASFIGLLLTTLSNSFILKKAKVKRDANKNDYYNFLQAELLPILNRDLSDRLKTLEGTLRKFSEEFSGKLFKNLAEFNQKFEENNKKFGENTALVVNNLKLQKEFLDKLGNQEVEKIISANVEIFNKIDNNKEFFSQLFDYTKEIKTVLDESKTVSQKIENLINKVTGFEKNIELLTKGFTRNELVIQKYIKDVLKRSKQLKERYEAIISHINDVDNENSTYIATEQDAIHRLTQTSLRELEQVSNDLRASIVALDNEIKEKMKRSFDFSDEKGKFKDLLNAVEKEINGLTTALKEEGHTVVEAHKGTMTKLTDESLDSYRKALESVRASLSGIEQLFENLAGKKSKTEGGTIEEPPPPPPPPNPSIWTRIKLKFGIKNEA